MTRLKIWTPALLMMAIIFGFSSIPSEEMPTFVGYDFVIKKLGHAIGYALLAVSYLRGLKFSNRGGHPSTSLPLRGLRRTGFEHEGKSLLSLVSFVSKHPSFFAWLMAVTFSATDEFHQSFVPGRNPSVWDVLLFDNLGALAGIWAYTKFFQSGK